MYRIYYGDGTTFSDADGEVWDAPRQDVQVIIQSDERVGWRWCSGGDYFYYDESLGGWQTSNLIWDHLIRCRHPLVLMGRQMRDDEWHELFARAKRDMGDKQGWMVSEDRR